MFDAGVGMGGGGVQVVISQAKNGTFFGRTKHSAFQALNRSLKIINISLEKSKTWTRLWTSLPRRAQGSFYPGIPNWVGIKAN